MIGGAGTGCVWARAALPASKRQIKGTRRFIRSQRGIQTGGYFNHIGLPVCRPKQGRGSAGAVLEPRPGSRAEARSCSAIAFSRNTSRSAIRGPQQKRPSIEGLSWSLRRKDQAAAAISSSQVISSVSSVAPSPLTSMTNRTVLASSAIMTITAFPAPVIVSSPTNG